MAKAPTMDEWVEKLGTKTLKGFVYNGRTLREWIDLMASGYCVVLPNGATNGDVIKTVFSDGHYGTNGDYVYVFDVGGNGVWTFTKEWWNAKYKAGDAG